MTNAATQAKTGGDQTRPIATDAREAVSLAITGAGGAGVITAGDMLLSAAAAQGLYGLMTRSAGPQIRGGEAAALVTLSASPVAFHKEAFDVLLAVDWSNTDRFAAELPLTDESLVVGDEALADKVPDFVATGPAARHDLPLKETAGAVPGGRVNMVVLGLAAELLGLSEETVDRIVGGKLADKGEAAIDASRQAVAAGRAAGAGLPVHFRLTPHGIPSGRWLISGNEAAGLGAVRGGVRFAAAYPITPATEILEWLAPALAKIGGNLVQAEDELASINMIIGASFAGLPSVTATSGPGLALMIEAIGLATAAEVPVVVIDVMRGGPSTGIPTKSEQSDLNIAIYGPHGDAPHVVVAPSSIADCVYTTQWAVHLAEALQAPAIVLSDQSLGQARAVVDRPADLAFLSARKTAPAPGADYRRYADSADGVSAMALPGTPGGQYTAEGLEHSTRGTPSSRAEDHIAQLDKRRRKIDGFDYGDHWVTAEGDGPLALITWGSTAAPVLAAARRARQDGVALRTIVPRLLAPARPEAMAALLDGVETAIVVEQSEGAQFHRYLRSHYDLPRRVHSLHRPGPLPFRVSDILNAIDTWSGR